MSNRRREGIIFSLVLLSEVFIRIHRTFVIHANDDSILDLMIDMIMAGVFIIAFYAFLLDDEIEARKYWYSLICSLVLLKSLDLINLPQIVEYSILFLIFLAVLFSLKGFYFMEHSVKKSSD